MVSKKRITPLRLFQPSTFLLFRDIFHFMDMFHLSISLIEGTSLEGRHFIYSFNFLRFRTDNTTEKPKSSFPPPFLKNGFALSPPLYVHTQKKTSLHFPK